MTCRCKRDNVDGQHLCHGQGYTCPQVGIRRLIATNACLAGTQPKVGVYETWACELCFAEFQALRGAKPADGGAGLTGGAAVDAAAGVPVAALDEVDARGPALVDGDHADGFLVEIPRDRAGGALGLRVEVPAAGGGRRSDQVDDDGGLPLALPEAASLDVGRGREPDGDVLLHAACELRRVDGDGPACGRERPEPATDQERRTTGGHEGPKGTSGAATATGSGHGSSVTDQQAALQPLREAFGREIQTLLREDPEIRAAIKARLLRLITPRRAASWIAFAALCGLVGVAPPVDPPESGGGVG